MLENLAGIVDKAILWDDRGAEGDVSSEPARRQRLVEAALSTGADWALAIDPDERLSGLFAAGLPRLCSPTRLTIWNFPVRELYTPDAWRSDGLWAGKTIERLWRLTPDERHDFTAFHGSWAPIDPRYVIRPSDLEIFHLKHIDPARRQARRDLYASLDPARECQPIGYDYLADESGLALTPIRPEAMYRPAHIDDCELWMPRLQPVRSDPAAAMIERARTEVLKGASEGARRVLEKAATLPLTDEDRRALARLAALFPDPTLARQLLTELVTPTNEDLVALLDLGADLPATGPAADVIRLARGLQPGTQTQTSLFQELGWVKAATTITVGAEVPRADQMATIVLGHNCPATFPAAVGSLLSDDPDQRVIVVNTGSDRLSDVLGPLAHRVIMAETPIAARAGAARNIGAALATEPHVAFLASDCRAQPGWIQGRLAAHRAGPTAVSSHLCADPAANDMGKAHLMFLHPLRLPETPEGSYIHFGMSYPRRLHIWDGWYDPHLPCGEDTIFNREVLGHTVPKTRAAAVSTEHLSPGSGLSGTVDFLKRGYRQGKSEPYIKGFAFGKWNVGLPGTYLLAPVEYPLWRIAALRKAGGLTRLGWRGRLWLAPFACASALGILCVLPEELFHRSRAFWLWLRLGRASGLTRAAALQALAGCEPLDPSARASILDRLPPA